jgi:tetratricopeptide (TPR) repeat protein
MKARTPVIPRQGTNLFLFAWALLFAIEGRAASLVCNFADEQRKALRNVEVQLEASGSTQPVYQRSDKNGEAIFRGLKPGGYELRAQLKDHVPLRWEVTVAEDQKLALTLMTQKRFEALDQEAGQAINNRDFTKAQEILEKLLAAYPGDAVLHDNLGRAYAGQLQEEKALAEAEKAARLDPSYAGSKQTIEAFILRARGDKALGNREFAVAAELFGRLTKLDPKNADGYYGMALAYGHMENYKQALAAINSALALDPQNNAYLKVKEILQKGAGVQ